MSKSSLDLQGLVDDLKRQRDEIRVRLHLGKAEARDEWQALEKTWEHLRGKMDVVGHEAGTAAHEVGAALKLAVEELRKGYERIAQRL